MKKHLMAIIFGVGGAVAVMIALMIAIITIFMGSATSQKDCDSEETQSATTTATVAGDWTKSGTSANTNAKAVFDYWTQKKGFSGAAAAGIVGNIAGAEDSSFTLDQKEIGGGADGGGGLYQFTPRSKYLNGSSTVKKTWKGDWSADDQGDAVWALEVSNGIGNGYNGYAHMSVSTYAHLNDIEKATLQWMWGYERPAKNNSTGPSRIAAAQTAYKIFNGSSIAANDSLLGGASSTAATGTATGSDSNGCATNTGSGAGGDWGWPFKSIKNNKPQISGEQLFGKSSSRQGGFHDGVDFGTVPYGGQDILAIHGGTVYKIGHQGHTQNDLGYYVFVKSDDGYYEVHQEFAFEQSDADQNLKVKEGDTLKTGDRVGTLNQVGDVSHVHIGVSKTELSKAQNSAFKDDGTWIDWTKLVKK